MSNLTVLKNYSTDWEAELIKSKLASEGIESIIQAADPSQLIPYLNFASGFSICVLQEDFDKAYQVVSNSDDTLSEEAEIGAEE